MSFERAVFAKRVCAPLVVACLSLFAPSAPAQKLDIQYAGDQANEFNGWCVSSGFDCDGDGIDDVALSAPWWDPIFGSADQGTVVVHSGATHAVLWGYTVFGTSAHTGFSFALVGDVDGDGYGDIAFGAPGLNNGDGYVAVWSVKTSALLWHIYGATGEGLGSSVAAAGDVDHDGHMDVLVGAPGGGNVYLFGWGTGALHVWSGSTSAGFGQVVAGNADVDGDGTPDVIVGSPNYSSAVPFSLDRGRVDVYSGATWATLWTAVGDHAGDEFGHAIVAPGDMNGDGRSEVLVGTSWCSTNGSHSGLVRKFDGTGAKLVDLVGTAAYEEYGASLAVIPDVDGDGRAEYAIGATQAGAGGFAELHRGTDDALLWTYLPPDSSYTEYGFSIAGGDMNGDGLGDVVIGDSTRKVSGLTDVGDADVWLTLNATAFNYGPGYPGTLGIPSLTAQDDPGIGKTFTVAIGNSLGSATTGLVFLGFTRLYLPTSAGGVLLVAPSQTFVVPIPAAGTTLSGAIPLDPALLGLDVYLQVLETDPGAAHKLSFTAGLDARIGVDY